MKKQVLFFVLVLFPLMTSAFTGRTEINGIYYNVITKANIAEVSYGDVPYTYNSITIPSTVEYEGITCNVTAIGEEAFKNCISLVSISLPTSITSIGAYAFANCTSMINITIPENVTLIDIYSFSQCTSLTSINIPQGLTNIAERTFSDCSSLTSVVIPDNVISIGANAFRNCTSLVSVNIGTGVESIEASAFRDCDSLESIDIPNNVTNLAAGAFRECNNLTSVKIGNGIKIIYGATFYSCPNLRSVSIGSNVTSIGPSAFGLSTSLTTITIPNSVTIIEDDAFNGCGILSTVYIGSGCKQIGYRSFASCPEIHDVYCYATSCPSTNVNAFLNSYINYATLHVPTPSINAYKSSAPWSDFSDVISLPYINYIVDDELYKQDLVMIGSSITPIAEPTKEGYTFSGWSEIPETMPAHDVTVTGTFTVNQYKLVYKVDDVEYRSYDINYGTSINPEQEPQKEGYTFSGWIDLPKTMPAHDVTVTGTFTVNQYKLVYKVDGKEYKTYNIDYKATISPESEPTKEGHTFSGWSEIPETMPAHDVTVTGTFTVNQYTITYMIDAEVYQTESVDYGSTITPPDAPEHEGYSFEWIDVPETMPAHDVTVTGLFTVNKYKLTYMVDGEEYKTSEVEYDTTISPESEPTKEGYTFSGWSEIPETMPAHDVTVTGTFTVNQYTITYIVDNEVFMTDEVDYGSTITPPSVPVREGYDFAWSEYPTTMPAYDITIYGTYTTGIEPIYNNNNKCKYYSLDGQPIEKPRKGVNIVRMSDGTVKKIIVK